MTEPGTGMVVPLGPTELAELFEKNPGDMGDADLNVIVRKMRDNRTQFELGLKAPIGERKKKAPTRVAGAADQILKDLGLETPTDLLKDLGL